MDRDVADQDDGEGDKESYEVDESTWLYSGLGLAMDNFAFSMIDVVTVSGQNISRFSLPKI